MYSVLSDAFVDEFEKLAKRSAVELLSSLAKRKGVDPTQLPAIKQVGKITSSGDRGRAAEVAQNVRKYLKAPPARQAA